MTDFTTLPAGLPVPVDDGAADHLTGAPVPPLILPASDGTLVDLGGFGPDRTVVYLYPLTGRPDVEVPAGWDSIPGARGCSIESCGFRDRYGELRDAGAKHTYGLSSQSAEYQAEAVERLRLPFAMISDRHFELAEALRLPTFRPEGCDRLYKRLTLVIRENRIEHAFYPVFPLDTHAGQVLDWLVKNPTATADQPS